MRTMVTGAAGFIGSHLVDALVARGHEAVAIDNFSTGRATNLSEVDGHPGVEVHHVDLLDADFTELVMRSRSEIVFHLAAQMNVRHSLQHPAHDVRTNVEGSVRLLEATAAAGVRKVVFASSGGTVYGPVSRAELPISEQHPRRPISPYGVAKLAVDQYLECYRATSGVNFTSLALANVYGPRQNPRGEAGVVSLFAHELVSGRSCRIYGDGSQTRDFVYVDDAVDALVRAIDRADGRYLNVGTGIATTILDVHDRLAKLLEIEAYPELDARIAGELDHNALDCTLAERVLGWRAHTDLDTGLQRTVD